MRGKLATDKFRKLFIWEVYIQLVNLRIYWYPRSSSPFHKG